MTDSASFAAARSGHVNGIIDARPVGDVGQDTAWDRTRNVRDRFSGVIKKVLDDVGVEALVLKSQDGNYPVWVRLEAWLPNRSAPGAQHHLRSTLEIVVEARPFHTRPLIYAVRATSGNKAIAIEHATRFEAGDVREWTLFVVGGGSTPSSYHPKQDAFFASLGAAIPMLGPHYNPLAAAYRVQLASWPLAAGLAAVPVYALAAWAPGMMPAIAAAAGVVTLLLAAVVLVLGHRARTLVVRAVQPEDTPRRLFHIDSWYAVVNGLKGGEAKLERRIRAKLADLKEHGISSRIEAYGFRKPNGYDERERIVLSRGQGYMHVHVARLGDDLFVGWESQLNWAHWAETQPVARKYAGIRETEFRSLAPGWYLPGDVDLFDLESLSALVHHAIEREIKAVMRERNVTRDIDFEIIRADRDQILKHGRLLSQQRPESGTRAQTQVLGTGGVQETSLSEMALAPPGDPVAVGRGWLAALPPMLMLPLIVTLLYAPFLADINSLNWMALSATDTPNIRFQFAPMLYLPMAIAMAIGLRTWAGIPLVHALVLPPLALVLCLGSVYAASLVLPFVLPSRQSPPPGMTAFISFYTSLFVSIAVLVATSVMAPQLRRPRFWLIAAIAMSLAAALAALAIQGSTWPREASVALRLSRWVVFSAVAGYWLQAAGRWYAFSSLVKAIQPGHARTSVFGGVTRLLQNVERTDSPVRAGGWAILGLATFAMLVTSAGTRSLGGDAAFIVVNGLAQGSLYALAGLGVVLVLKTSGSIILSQGAMMTLGAYGAWFMSQGYSAGYWPALAAVPVVVGAAAAYAAQSIKDRTEALPSTHVPLVTLGIAFIIIGALEIAFGIDVKQIDNPIPGMVQADRLFVPWYQVWVIAAGLAGCAFALWVSSGALAGATASQFGSAYAKSSMFGLASGLAAFAGILSAPMGIVSTGDAITTSLGALAAATLAGTGSLWGVIATGFVLGLIEVVAGMFAGDMGPTVWVAAIVFGLLLRPNGLFGGAVSTTDARLPASDRFSARSLLVILALTGGGVVAAASIYPSAMPLATATLCNAMLALPVGFMLAWLGLLSLGHAMFFGLAAYTAIIVANEWGWPMEFGLLAGAAAAAGLAIPAGLIALRRGAVYFAATTLILATLVERLATNLPITGGLAGMIMYGRPRFLGFELNSPASRFVGVFALFALSLWIIKTARHSSVVAGLLERRAPLQDETSGELFAKLQVFVLSAALAGIAGAAYGYAMSFVSTNELVWTRSADAVATAVIGGTGSLIGPVAGSLALLAPSYLSAVPYEWMTLVKGFALVWCALYLRDGLMGLFPASRLNDHSRF